MEAEVIAMSNMCRELYLVKSVGSSVRLEQTSSPKLHITIHKDNTGALILATTLLPQFTPRSKYYAIMTWWFHEVIEQEGDEVVAIDTKEQLGDIFTKMPPQVVFEYLRYKIQG